MWLLLKLSLFQSDVPAWNIMKVLHCHRAVSVIGNNILNFASAGYNSCCFTEMWLGCFPGECLLCVRAISPTQVNATNQRKCLRWAAQYSSCVQKSLVPLLCHVPAACFGVNKPCFCSSALTPEGREPGLQLEVLIKAFRGDYAAGLPGFRAGEVVGKRLSLKCL